MAAASRAVWSWLLVADTRRWRAAQDDAGVSLHRRRAGGPRGRGKTAARRRVRRSQRAGCFAAPAGGAPIRRDAGHPHDSSDRPPHGVRAHDGGRLRQHLRAVAAAADSPARSQSRRGRNADHAVPAVGVGRADRVWALGGSLASTAPRHHRTDRGRVDPEFRRHRDVAAHAGSHPGRRRAGRRGVSPTGSSTRPSPRRRAPGLLDVGLHHRRHAGILARSAAVRPVRRAVRPHVDAVAGAALVSRWWHSSSAACPRFRFITAGGSGFRALRPYARPLALLYFIVVLRTLAAISFATFLPVMLTRRGLSLAASATAVAGYLFASGLGGFFGGPAADRFGPKKVIALSLVLAVPFLFVAPTLNGWQFQHSGGDWRVFPAIHPSGERHIRTGDRTGQRRDGVFADDGVRLGHGRVERANRGVNRRPDRHRGHAAGTGARPARRGGVRAAAAIARTPCGAGSAVRSRCARTLMVG